MEQILIVSTNQRWRPNF